MYNSGNGTAVDGAAQYFGAQAMLRKHHFVFVFAQQAFAHPPLPIVRFLASGGFVCCWCAVVGLARAT